MSFIEYKTARVKKPQEELESGKTWQVKARRLYIPLQVKKYGLEVNNWEEEGKKKHSITWKYKPYAKLLINDDKKAKAFVRLEVNTSAGLAIQVDPANHKRFYISIPEGAKKAFPKESCMLGVGIQEDAYIYSRK